MEMQRGEGWGEGWEVCSKFLQLQNSCEVCSPMKGLAALFQFCASFLVLHLETDPWFQPQTWCKISQWEPGWILAKKSSPSSSGRLCQVPGCTLNPTSFQDPSSWYPPNKSVVQPEDWEHPVFFQTGMKQALVVPTLQNSHTPLSDLWAKHGSESVWRMWQSDLESTNPLLELEMGLEHGWQERAIWEVFFLEVVRSHWNNQHKYTRIIASKMHKSKRISKVTTRWCCSLEFYEPLRTFNFKYTPVVGHHVINHHIVRQFSLPPQLLWHL